LPESNRPLLFVRAALVELIHDLNVRIRHAAWDFAQKPL
jgi:hypothetical protein